MHVPHMYGVYRMSLAGDALEHLIERTIFYPDPFLIQGPADFGLEFTDMWFRTDDGVRLHGWLFPNPESEGLLLFCHGNAGNISHRLDNIFRLHRIGLSVFIFDYRGYGRSEGRITEEGFYLDSEAAYRVAMETAKEEQAKLVIFGRSLGGIAATHIASANPCCGVILESTFTHLGALAGEYFPLPMMNGLLRSRFNSVDKIGKIKAPKLFFHGDRDDIVPFRYGRELFESAPEPKGFVTLSGAGHNDTYIVGGKEYFERIKSFVTHLSESPIPAG